MAIASPLSPRSWSWPLILGFFVVVTGILRFFVLDSNDPYFCNSALTSGFHLNPVEGKNWQPHGCILAAYSTKDVSTCIPSSKRILLVGDSMVRENFKAWGRLFGSNFAPEKPHSDSEMEYENLRIEFKWDPYLNSTGAQAALNNHNNARDRPAITLIGTGLWHLRYEMSNNPVEKWKNTIDQFVHNLTADISLKSDFILFQPVGLPEYKTLDEARKIAFIPEAIREMNEYLGELSQSHSLNVAQSFNQMMQSVGGHASDGFHPSESVATTQLNLLLNLRCNQLVSTSPPFDKTCCFKYPSPNYIQIILLLLSIFILPIIALLSFRRTYSSITNPSASGGKDVFRALTIFLGIIAFCYLADRTQVYAKQQKSWSIVHFMFLVSISIIVGSLTLQKSEKHQTFLNRNQTDEWKGWMQLLILIYHYFGASKISPIYAYIRMLVASYLFLSAYGHATYFYKKSDYSFRRIANVLVRINLLPLFLAYFMGNDYLFYYFSPLVSFWFIVIWGIMWIGHPFNTNLHFLIPKLLLGAAATFLFVTTPGILEFVFDVFHTLFRTQWDIKEWRFRLLLDIWIPWVGVFFAVTFIRLSNAEFSSLEYFERFKKYSLIASVAGLVSYLIFEVSCKSKFVYNSWNPYISFIPILSFIFLRNSTQSLRNTHSKFFAYIGQCSLETYTLQFHIWLAADTKGLLILYPTSSRWLNFSIVTTLFIGLSHTMAQVTGILTDWIVGSRKKKSVTDSTEDLIVPIALHHISVEPADDRASQIDWKPNWVQKLRDGCETRTELRIPLLMGFIWVLNLVYLPSQHI